MFQNNQSLDANNNINEKTVHPIVKIQTDINTLWNKYIIKYNIKPLSINIYDTDLHDIKYVVNKQLIE